jgi:anti-anti-sigma regulatory factor
MNIKVTLGESEVLVVMSGEAQVDNAATIAKVFQELAGTESKLLTFDLSGLTEIDITFIQLLYSLSNTLARKGRHLMVFSLPPAHPVMRRSSLSGIRFDHHFTMAEKTG